eukprot:scaffold1403_cov381-Prasinococcus_capsulatus_cf.AAC.7
MLLHPRALAMATAVDGPPIAAFEAISRDWRGILSTDLQRTGTCVKLKQRRSGRVGRTHPTTATKMKWTRSETRMNRRTQLPDATRAPGPADAPRTTKNGSRSARPISKAGLNTAPNPSTPLLTKLASSPVKAFRAAGGLANRFSVVVPMAAGSTLMRTSREATAAAKTSWRLANSGPQSLPWWHAPEPHHQTDLRRCCRLALETATATLTVPQRSGTRSFPGGCTSDHRCRWPW